jgi:hypothetical protein
MAFFGNDKIAFSRRYFIDHGGGVAAFYHQAGIFGKASSPERGKVTVRFVGTESRVDIKNRPACLSHRIDYGSDICAELCLLLSR